MNLKASERVLPRRGLAFATYPQRATPETPWPVERWLQSLRSRLRPCPNGALPPELAARLVHARRETLPQAHDLLALPKSPIDSVHRAHWAQTVARCRQALRRRGLQAEASAQAFALAAHALRASHGVQPYDTQILAAWWMLTGHLAEMATGEGKTLATALAAAVAGLGGTPVHVITANDYLVQRDADALRPFFSLLGLSCTTVTASSTPDARRLAWQQDIVYTSARELAFDYLRDHLMLQGERDALMQRAQAIGAGTQGAPAQGAPASAGSAADAATPTLPGLCLALIDEADSVLLDEAVVPLLLAQAEPASAEQVAAWRSAFEISQPLQRQRDYRLRPEQRSATLTKHGRHQVALAVQGQTGPIWPPRRACELVQAALAARWQFKRDRDYLVVDEKLQLIDTLTGRVAEGRQWQGALHPMVEIKEGLTPSHPSRTAAQITYQRFFPRYLKLGGMSGTLLEARHELAQVYRAPVARVPLAHPDRRRWLGQQVFARRSQKWAAVLEAVAAQRALGRPVLVGTDSVADSKALADLLARQGLPCRLLNASQDQDEALAVAQAGECGQVTVATNMAGRGTDIVLSAEARRLGGLHVIATMRNRSRRIDRQLLGRAARQGDPGSAQALLALDDSLPCATLPGWLRRAVAAWAGRREAGLLPGWLGRALMALAQALAERQDRQRRARLRQADQEALHHIGFEGGME